MPDQKKISRKNCLLRCQIKNAVLSAGFCPEIFARISTLDLIEKKILEFFSIDRKTFCRNLQFFNHHRF